MSRWFQLETGGQELAAPRTVRRGARPKRLQYDDIDGVSDDSADLSDIAEGEEEGECEQLLGRDEDEKGVEISESDDEAPSQFSTPLKTAYSRHAPPCCTTQCLSQEIVHCSMRALIKTPDIQRHRQIAWHASFIQAGTVLPEVCPARFAHTGAE